MRIVVQDNKASAKRKKKGNPSDDGDRLDNLLAMMAPISHITLKLGCQAFFDIEGFDREIFWEGKDDSPFSVTLNLTARSITFLFNPALCFEPNELREMEYFLKGIAFDLNYSYAQEDCWSE